MARIRSIKPEFFKNEDLAELTFPCRLLFIGLWTLADVAGRLEDRPKRIKAEIFPYDSLNADDLLERLQSAGFIKRYGFGDLKVIEIINFKKHQRITGSEADSITQFPDPQEIDVTCSITGDFNEETLWKHFGNTLETPRTTGREGKGKEGKRKGRECIARPEFGEFENYFLENGFSSELAKKAYGHYGEEWADARGNPVKNWKQKARTVWFSEENKEKEKKVAPKKEKESKSETLRNTAEDVINRINAKYGDQELFFNSERTGNC